MPSISSGTVVIVALAFAAVSSLLSQIASARVIALLKSRYTPVWEEVISRPDTYRRNRRRVSSGRVLRIVQQQVPSLSRDSKLRRLVAALRFGRISVVFWFVVCVLAAVSREAGLKW